MRKRLIGIDYGTKRIGLAKTDPLGLFAQPVGTCKEDALQGLLGELLAAGDVRAIVVGHPLDRDGGENAMTAVVDRFIASLREAFPDTPVTTVDEHGTSREAAALLVASGKSRRERQRKGRLDTAAACLLLERYMQGLPPD